MLYYVCVDSYKESMALKPNIMRLDCVSKPAGIYELNTYL